MVLHIIDEDSLGKSCGSFEDLSNVNNPLHPLVGHLDLLGR